MRLYTLYSESHRELYEKFYKPSIPDGFDPVSVRVDQEGSGVFMDGYGWKLTMDKKLDLILTAIEENDEPFVYADCDIQFFRPCADHMLECLGDHEIAFQCDWWGWGAKCFGLFIARPTENLKNVIINIKQLCTEDRGDQEVLNDLLKEDPNLLDDVLLPHEYWTHGASDGKEYRSEMALEVPSDIITHPANWVKGNAGKTELMQRVKNIVTAR